MTLHEATLFAAHLATKGVAPLHIRWAPREDGTGTMAVTGWTHQAFETELSAWRASR